MVDSYYIGQIGLKGLFPRTRLKTCLETYLNRLVRPQPLGYIKIWLSPSYKYSFSIQYFYPLHKINRLSVVKSLTGPS